MTSLPRRAAQQLENATSLIELAAMLSRLLCYFLRRKMAITCDAAAQSPLLSADNKWLAVGLLLVRCPWGVTRLSARREGKFAESMLSLAIGYVAHRGLFTKSAVVGLMPSVEFTPVFSPTD